MDKSLTLLIVDDEPFNLDILQENLEDEGFEIVRAEDGPTALKILESGEHDFAAMLLDRMMPHMDGLEVLKTIKNSEEHKHLPVVIQTAAASDKDVMEGIEAGAFYYLTKPFEPELMITIVHSAITDHQNLVATLNSKNDADDIFSLIEEVTVNFSTIGEAQRVAGRISNLFPDPDKVLLGLTELVINAVEHGNLGITYEEKSSLLNENLWHSEIERRQKDKDYVNKVASLSFAKNDSEYVVVVKDQGLGFNWEKFLDMNAERAYDSHGRGIAMAGMISFDKLEYKGCGNEVHCIVKRESS